MRRFLLISVSLWAMCGCAVGPDFERPKAPDITSYEETTLPEKTVSTDTANSSGVAQSFLQGQDIPASWWTLFHSDPLNQMISKAIQNNPDLAAAQASLHAAEEDEAATESLLWPSLGASFSTTRQKVAGASYGGDFPSSIYTLHNASVSMSYGLDIWGGARRSIEESEAQVDVQRFQLEAAYLTLTANVATAAIREASLRGQIVATKQIIKEETKQRDLMKAQLDNGSIARGALLAQQATLAASQATLPPLENQLALTRHLLSVLAGQFPSTSPEGVFDLASLKLPGELPVTLPSRLVEQRPDVRAAEATLHAASAAIGVAEAARLPQIALSANIGDVATNLGKMFTPGSGIWSMGFDASQTLFDAGQLAHEQGSAEAHYDVAAAQYRKTVLTAFQNVADTLQALQSDATALASEAAAEKAAADNLSLSQEQYKDGATSYLDLLTAEQTEEHARLSLVAAEAQRYADTAALFEALGGGWWNRSTDITQPPAAELSPTAVVAPSSGASGPAPEIEKLSALDAQVLMIKSTNFNKPANSARLEGNAHD